MRLFTLLKNNEWPSDSYLSRKMRQYKKHGRTNVSNQIVLESGVYTVIKTKAGNTCLKIPTFTKGQKLAIPLKGDVDFKGRLRLTTAHGKVSVHATTSQKKFKACGTKIIGLDKGYSEAFADCDGNFYGKRLGEVLTTATETRSARGKARNKLHQIAKKKAHKAQNIFQFNLGSKKLDRFHEKQKILIRDTAFEAVHRIVDNAGEVIAEDLTKPFANKNKWKKYNRLMSAWAKGSLAEALESVTKARGSSLRVVNAAYTSQMDSKTGLLQGRRVGDKFHH